MNVNATAHSVTTNVATMPGREYLTVGMLNKRTVITLLLGNKALIKWAPNLDALGNP